MTITAKVIKDSVSSAGIRLITLQLCYPRFIHAEFMTHRVFSRNASSSRAIPVAKMIEQVKTNPAMPIHWGKNQPGLQANEQLTGDELVATQNLWLRAANKAADVAEQMMLCGAHKQVANRILEPFQHIHVVVTATEWKNFFDLRCHPDAQPEIRELATQMLGVINASSPNFAFIDEWHLPYVTQEEHEKFKPEALLKISVARCARVSYLKHDGTDSDPQEDIALHDKLVVAKPIHASPAEHQATPDFMEEHEYGKRWACSNLHGNFRGWIQYRKKIEV